ATKGDKPDWLTPPMGVTTASVCRLSGKLATDNCREELSVNPDGTITSRSMVYTEYFARGTAPTEYCDLHTAVQTRIASSGSVITDHPAPRIDPTPVPAPPPPPPTHAASPTTTASDGQAPTTTAKRRGFWGRLFGLGRGGGQQREPESPPPP